MGRVYLAQDPELGRYVAVKVVLEEGHRDESQKEEAFQRFLREARIGARLLHPNIVTVLDAGRDGNQLFLVMEYVQGESLHARIDRGEFPSLSEALRWIAQAAEGLAYAHRLGVIHRDIKPANLLITPDGQIKIADFGVAKAISENTQLTRAGMMVGSPAYMSPEQIRGEPLDGRSDLFSLGVILFELLQRRRPFAAETVTALVYQILHEDPLAEATIGRSLAPPFADLLRWTLAKDREQRVPEARLLAERLRELAESLQAVPTSVVRPRPEVVSGARALFEESTSLGSGVRPSGRGWPLLVAVAGLAGVVLGLGVFLVLREANPPKRPEVGSQLEPLSEPPKGLTQPVSELTQASSTPAGTPTPTPELVKPAAVATAVPAQIDGMVAPTPTPSRPEPLGLGWPPAGEPKPPSAPAPTPVPLSESQPVSPPPLPLNRESSGMAAAGTRTTSPSEDVAPPPVVVAKSYATRKSVKFDIDPEEAYLEIDGKVIGTADEWDGMGGAPAYEFDRPGSHLVKVFLSGYETVWLRIEVDPNAKKAVVSVDYELKKARSK